MKTNKKIFQNRLKNNSHTHNTTNFKDLEYFRKENGKKIIQIM